jgi:hypothetical protein
MNRFISSLNCMNEFTCHWPMALAASRHTNEFHRILYLPGLVFVNLTLNRDLESFFCVSLFP